MERTFSQDLLEIALKGSDEIHEWLSSNCADLKISNIRILKKIERLALQAEELLRFHQLVAPQGCHPFAYCARMVNLLS